ncbi:RNA pyrophosphohydrolase [Alphaproteobacteria bacterium]|nr:RNA pyrophosphohydrolase [Alphaproteobacteria bacterium]
MTDNVKLYRPCVGIALFNRQGEVFVGERIDTPGSWQMPQGGIDAGEDIEVAALRELQEETGISSVEVLEIASETIRYDLPPALIEKKMWKTNYAGQEQTWVAMRFVGDEAEVNLSAHEPPEFSQWKWVNLAETLDLIVPFKQDVYRQVISIFSKYSTFG